MQRGRLYFLYTWVSVWTFIAVGNIHHTFELLESNKTFAIPTVVNETEKDTSQMEMETEVSKVKEDCSSQAFWKNNIDYLSI